MKLWKWASVRGCPERMIAARSHSMSSKPISIWSENSIVRITFVEIGLVEIVRSWNIHIVETSDLFLSDRAPLSIQYKHTFLCPLKCCNSFISRSARLAKIFLLKTLVTFLIATPSWVWVFVAALVRQQLAKCQQKQQRQAHTRQCRKHLDQAPLSPYISHRQ